MGYSVHQSRSVFRIKRENIPAALKAIQTMVAPDPDTGHVLKYSWVSAEFYKKSSLTDILSAWRWGDVECDVNGDIRDICFQGEKLGDDKVLFFHLAPYVEHGSYIEMIGEDDDRWRWVFWRGELREEYPRIIWDYEQMTPAMELAEVIGEELAETA